MKKLFTLIAVGSASLLLAEGTTVTPVTKSEAPVVKTEPVKQVTEQVAVKITDQDIVKKVDGVLHSNEFAKTCQMVTFEVKDGKVMLKGNIGTPEMKTKLEAAIKKIEGVKAIDNQIMVK